MRFGKDTAEFYVPDGKSIEEALTRTTHMGIGAHPDDLEIMAYHGILECYMKKEKRFLGVIITDGAGSPRLAHYASAENLRLRGLERSRLDS